MLAAPGNRARPQSDVPHPTIVERPILLPYVARPRQTLRKRSGPTSAHGSSARTGVPQYPFYNRLSEQAAFKGMLNNKPSVITVLLGPPNCGKTRFIQQLREQYKADLNAPLFLYINSRQKAVNGPEEISKALCDAITSEKLLLKLQDFPDLVETILEKFSVAKVGDFSIKMAELIQSPQWTIEKAFAPSAMAKRDQPPLWTPTQWKVVLERITTAPPHAVLQSELMNELDKARGWWPWGKSGGEDVLLSMVKYNLLALRPYSDLARDLPQEIYGDGEVLVTLPLPVHVWAAKQSLKKRGR